MKRKFVSVLMVVMLVLTSLCLTGCGRDDADSGLNGDMNQTPGGSDGMLNGGGTGGSGGNSGNSQLDDDLDADRDDLDEELRDDMDDLGNDIKDGAEDVLDGNDQKKNN